MTQPNLMLLTTSRELAEQVMAALQFEGLSVTVVDPGQFRPEGFLSPPDVLLMDVQSLSGPLISLLHRVKVEEAATFVAVLGLVRGEEVSPGAVLDAGADDVLSPRADIRELPARVRVLLRVKDMFDRMQESNRRLTELSSRDELTGLYNRRHFFERLAIEFERAVRYQQPLSCVMIDMDEFKPINDTYGHLVGDALFRRAADLFRAIPRKIDVVARYGGDEICMLLPATGMPAAGTVAERVREAMAHEAFEVSGRRIAMTVSVGVAVLDPADPISPDSLIRHADLALYAAKRQGRNSIAIWTRELESSLVDEAGPPSGETGKESP